MMNNDADSGAELYHTDLEKDIPDRNDAAPRSNRGNQSADPTHSMTDGALLAIRAIWRGRFWIAIATLIAGGAGAAYYANNPLRYESTAIIMRTEGELAEPVDPKNSWRPPIELVRLKHLATSSQMLHGLINRFDLYRHYMIDTTGPGYHELAMARLRRNIQVIVLDELTLAISVTDADRLKAKQLADGLVEQLQAMTRQLSQQQLELRLQLAQSMLRHQEGEITRHLDLLRNLAADWRPQMDATAQIGPTPFIDVQQQLVQIGAGLSVAHAEHQTFLRQLELAEAMRRTNNVGELLVVNHALLDMHRNPQSMISVWLLIWALVGGSLIAVLLALWGLEGPRLIAL